MNNSHNPAGLSAAQVGNGWRLLDEDEIIQRPWCHSEVFIEVWGHRGWSGHQVGNMRRDTYRTYLTRDQLARESTRSVPKDQRT